EPRARLPVYNGGVPGIAPISESRSRRLMTSLCILVQTGVSPTDVKERHQGKLGSPDLSRKCVNARPAQHAYLMRSKRRVLLHRKLGLKACEIAVNRGHREQPALVRVEQQTVARCDVAVDGDLVPFFGMADVVDRHVVMLAPEERYGVEGLALPQHVARG